MPHVRFHQQGAGHLRFSAVVGRPGAGRSRLATPPVEGFSQWGCTSGTWCTAVQAKALGNPLRQFAFREKKVIHLVVSFRRTVSLDCVPFIGCAVAFYVLETSLGPPTERQYQTGGRVLFWRQVMSSFSVQLK